MVFSLTYGEWGLVLFIFALIYGAQYIGRLGTWMGLRVGGSRHQRNRSPSRPT